MTQIVLLWGKGHHQSPASVLLRSFLICDAVLSLCFICQEKNILKVKLIPSVDWRYSRAVWTQSCAMSSGVGAWTRCDPLRSLPTWPFLLRSAKHHFQWAPHFPLSAGRSLLAEKTLLYVLLSVTHGPVPVLEWLQHAVDEISDLLSWIVYVWSMEAKRGKYHNGKLQLVNVTPTRVTNE